MYQEEKPIDLITVRDALIGRGELQGAGGVAYLVEIMEELPSAENIEYYARLVVQYYNARQIQQHAQAIAEISADATLTEAEKVAAIEKDYYTRLSPCIAEWRDDIVDEVMTIVEDSISGKRAVLGMPWKRLSAGTKAMLTGAVTLICGNPGASKSLMLLQAISYWMQQGISCAVYELEDGAAYHCMRALAQQTCTAGMTDSDWIRDNPTEALTVARDNVDFVQSMGGVITACDTTLPTLDQLADWVETRAREGKRVIAIDPVTLAVHARKDIWNEDRAFLERVKRAAVKHQCSIILVTHPTKLNTGPSLESLAGGAAYGRFCQSAIWLENHEPKTSLVRQDCGTDDLEYNRTIHILKARNGAGQGMKLACRFDRNSLTIQEEGLIMGKAKGE